MKNNPTFLLTSGISAALIAAVLVLVAAGIGWLLGSPPLAGALAMIVSATLILGFGGNQASGWTALFVAATWLFADSLINQLGIPRLANSISLAIGNFLVGMIPGKTREETILAGAGPLLGSVLGIILLTVFFPQTAAQNVEEAVISAAMISGARTVRQASEALKEWRG